MRAFLPFHRRILVIIAAAAAVTGLVGMGDRGGREARAQDAPIATADSSSTLPEPVSSATDSTSLSEAPATESPDSLGALEAARRTVPVPPWVPEASLGRAELDLMRVTSLAEALDVLPGAELRIAGDDGAPAFLSLGPISGPAPEILVDGVPSRSPADLDPSIWDRSIVAMSALDADPAQRWQPGGDPFLVTQPRTPIAGRTVMTTHFFKEAYESFLRGVSVTTPAAERIVEFDFEEWKTEEGYNFTLDPLRDGLPNDLGRSKMRRFRLGGDVATDLGRLRLSFGRGRRFYRGTVLATGPTERWTGEVVAGLDHEDSVSVWQVRGFHLDWHDDDFVHAETRDGVRLGVRATRMPKDAGLGLLLDVERWAAAFTSGAETRRPDPRYTGRAALSWVASGAANLRPYAAVELAYAELASTPFDVGGTASVRQRLQGAWGIEVGATRRLRTPTFLETDGLQTRDYANGVRLRREGAGPVPFERQDLAFLRLSGTLWRIELQGSLESWHLSHGIGWEPQPGNTTAKTVDDLALTVHVATASAALHANTPLRGIDLWMNGHQVLGTLTHAADRGAGWPLWAGRGTLRVWHQLINHHNRIFLEFSGRALGPRFDDMLAPLNSEKLAPITRVDLRAGVRVRDAELYLGWLDLLDETQVEVSGTRRRPREFRWGLHWPFYN